MQQDAFCVHTCKLQLMKKPARFPAFATLAMLSNQAYQNRKLNVIYVAPDFFAF